MTVHKTYYCVLSVPRPPALRPTHGVVPPRREHSGGVAAARPVRGGLM